MAVASGGRKESFPSHADYSAAGQQYRIMVVNADGRAQLSGANTAAPVGTLINKPGAQDRGATVQIDGITKIQIGAGVNEGDRLTSDGDGRAIATTTDKHPVVAMAMSAGTTSGDIIAAMLTPGSMLAN